MTGIARTFLLAGVAVLAASAALPRPAFAIVQQQARGLSVHDPLGALVAEALDANRSLAAARFAESAAAAGVREARGLLLPGASVAARYTGQRGTMNLGPLVNPAYATLNELTGSHQFPTNLDLPLPLRHETRLRITQPLYSPAARAQHQLMRHRHAAQSASRRTVARRIAADVQLAYLDVLSARSVVSILEAALERVTESERVTGRLAAAGRATADAVFRARAERSDVEQQLAEAEHAAASAARALNALLARPLDSPVPPVDDSLLIRELDLSEEQAVAGALMRREELGELSAGMRAAESGVRLARSGWLPVLAVALDYGFQGPDVRFSSDTDYLMGTVSLSWNVFSGGADQARHDAARHETARLRAQGGDVEEQVRLDVRNAYGAAVVARRAMTTAEERLAAALRTFELVSRRYAEGIATHIELVDARAALTDAELNRSLTLYRYVASTVDLERAAALRAID